MLLSPLSCALSVVYEHGCLFRHCQNTTRYGFAYLCYSHRLFGEPRGVSSIMCALVSLSAFVLFSLTIAPPSQRFPYATITILTFSFSLAHAYTFLIILLRFVRSSSPLFLFSLVLPSVSLFTPPAQVHIPNIQSGY